MVCDDLAGIVSAKDMPSQGRSVYSRSADVGDSFGLVQD